MKRISTFIIAFMIMILSTVNVFAEQVYLAEQGIVINPDSKLKWYTRDAEIGEEDVKYVGGSKESFKDDMIKKNEFLKLCDASSTYIIHVRIFDTDKEDYTNSMDDKMIADIEEEKVCGHFDTVGVKLSDVSTVSINFNKYGCAKYKDEDSGKVGYFVTIVRNKKMYCFVFDTLSGGSIGEKEMGILHELVGTVIYKTPDSTVTVNPESQHVQSSNTVRKNDNDGGFMKGIAMVLYILIVIVVVVAISLVVYKSLSDKKKLKNKIEFNTRRSINDIDRLNRILKDDFVEPEHIDKEAEEEKKWLGEEQGNNGESGEAAKDSGNISYMRSSSTASVAGSATDASADTARTTTESSEDAETGSTGRNSFLAD